MNDGLTPEETQAVEDLAARWEKHTDPIRPARRYEMAIAVQGLYSLARRPAPQRFIWTDDPVQYDRVVNALAQWYSDTVYELHSDTVPEPLTSDDFVFRSRISELVSGMGTDAYDWTNKVLNQRSYYSRITSNIATIGNTAFGGDLSDIVRPAIWTGNMQGGVFSRSTVFTLAGLRLVANMRNQHVPGIMGRAVDYLMDTVWFGGTWAAFQGGVVFCENPTEMHVAGIRLHNDKGPAMTWASGHKVYALNGRTVPERLVTAPETLTYKDIVDETNQEIRSLMIRAMGIGRFLTAMNAKLINESEVHGKLYEVTGLNDHAGFRRRGRWNQERVWHPAKFLVVENPTPEPDGSHRLHMLRVHHKYKTAHGARASTWNVAKKDFNLAQAT